MNFRAEAKSESSILLTWSPPRQDMIVKYELIYRGENQKEVRSCDGVGGTPSRLQHPHFFVIKSH